MQILQPEDIDSRYILCWFWAMGITPALLEKWLNISGIADILSEFSEKPGPPPITRITCLPLPHVVDVHVKLPSMPRYLVSNSQEDRLLTLQVLPPLPLEVL